MALGYFNMCFFLQLMRLNIFFHMFINSGPRQDCENGQTWIQFPSLAFSICVTVGNYCISPSPSCLSEIDTQNTNSQRYVYIKFLIHFIKACSKSCSLRQCLRVLFLHLIITANEKSLLYLSIRLLKTNLIISVPKTRMTKTIAYTVSAYCVIYCNHFTFAKPFISSPQTSNTGVIIINLHFIKKGTETERLSNLSQITQPVRGEDCVPAQVI